MLTYLNIMGGIVSLILFAFTPQHGVKTSDQQNSTQNAAKKEERKRKVYFNVFLEYYNFDSWQWVYDLPAEVNNLSKKERWAKYCEHEAEWRPRGKEHEPSHL